MASRGELKKEKEKTSQLLIRSALQLCEEEGYASLSLRSVARKAGIAPTSFYRHFREIDEMGVEMVAQAKAVLDECIWSAQKKMTFPAVKPGSPPAKLLKSIEGISGPFVDSFFESFGKHRQLLRLFFQERTGSSAAMQTAIAEAMDHIIQRLADALTQCAIPSEFRPADMNIIAEAMITLVSVSGMEMLVRPEMKQNESIRVAVRKVDSLLLGAMMQGQTKQE